MDERRAACARKPEECASGALPRNLGTAREPGGPGLYPAYPIATIPLTISGTVVALVAG
jgi:hypothetical protein